MLARFDRFESRVTLVQNSGVQFLDFGLTLDLRRELPGQFVPEDDGVRLLRLVYDDHRDIVQRPNQPGRPVRPKFDIPLEESLRLFDAIWLPVPLFRLNPPVRFAHGPETWCRARLVALTDTERDPDGHTHRLTLAIDTTVFDDDPNRRYLAPTVADVQAGVSFGLAHGSEQSNWFPALPWIDGWLRECFVEQGQTVLRLTPDELAEASRTLAHHGHYLNLLALIGQHAGVPQIKLFSNVRGDLRTALNVDMVLDIGNSRSFGILIEQHPKEIDGLKWRYELQLRDLSHSHHVYSEPFESRIELAQPVFGKENWAARSGRSGAFQWPTIGRVGPEAARLAGRRRGTEGATGISSPKRYLWDTDRSQTEWRFNSAYVRSENEPRAVAPPISMLVNEVGDALFEAEEEERIPVFRPHYSRSAMMTFMLAEVLAQTLSQINSVGQRLRMPNADLPRHLRSIILTVPPSMPKQERDIFEGRVREAVGIVWKALGWHAEDASIDWKAEAQRWDDPNDDQEEINEQDDPRAWPRLPIIKVSWDEATCGQIVYLYNESQNNYAGRTADLFARATRHQQGGQGSRLKVASVDIGGGTTDLVINDYLYDPDELGPGAYIVPEQRFRDGFRIAGDDILLQVIQTVLVPAVASALKDAGISDPQTLLTRLMGTERLDVRESVLRQQLVVQLIYPAGLALLRLYEEYDPFQGAPARTVRLGDLAHDSGGTDPSASVLDFVQRLVRQEQGAGAPPFDLIDIPVKVDLPQMHRLFLSERFELGGPIRSLCEIIHRYGCDILLLTGRPSRLPGIQFLFRALLPLPPDRIIPLHAYRTGSWYPFNRRGYIGDPKTTAAVGAMLCMLGRGRLPNFYLRSEAFQPYSTIRYLGVMDNNMVIKDEDLIYRDLKLDDPDYRLPERPFPVLGLTRIGFRQLGVARWAASPLYQIDVDRTRLDRIYSEGSRLLVWLQRCPGRGQEEYLCVHQVQYENGSAAPRNSVLLQLNTLTTIGLHNDTYWLDSGGIYR